MPKSLNFCVLINVNKTNAFMAIEINFHLGQYNSCKLVFKQCNPLETVSLCQYVCLYLLWHAAVLGVSSLCVLLRLGLSDCTSSVTHTEIITICTVGAISAKPPGINTGLNCCQYQSASSSKAERLFYIIT